MNKKCSKCGAETNYNGDLHCRNIFVEKLNEFLSAKNFTEARNYYLSQSFDDEWKKNLLNRIGGGLRRLIFEELDNNKKREQITAVTRHRISNCYACKKPLDNLKEIECNRCGWIVCSCGACGCRYDGQDFNE